MPRSRAIKALAITTVAVLALAFPAMAPNPYVIHVVTVGLIYAILAASWDFLYGYAGQLSFGHAGFFGLGAYTSALLSLYLDLSPWVGLLCGGGASALFGAVVGYPALRLKGSYLALATLAFGEIARIIATNWQDVTRGTLGLSGFPAFPGIPYSRPAYYYLALALAVVCVGTMAYLGNHSRIGLVMRSVRADEIRANTLGVNILVYKVFAYVMCAFFAGIAGGFYAHYIQVITPNELGPTVSIFTITMATIGGIGTIYGPAIAGVLFESLYEYMRGIGVVYNLVAVGALLISFVILLPRGLAGVARSWWLPPHPHPIQPDESGPSASPALSAASTDQEAS
ncbi:MAG TPA: branched-chain amino acid ABC transporter permease [Gemmatimonadales bacterium]|nr:branched-chain amino acid ABC transporter permease [Gemmatimonadales bacterium]